MLTKMSSHEWVMVISQQWDMFAISHNIPPILHLSYNIRCFTGTGNLRQGWKTQRNQLSEADSIKFALTHSSRKQQCACSFEDKRATIAVWGSPVHFTTYLVLGSWYTLVCRACPELSMWGLPAPQKDFPAIPGDFSCCKLSIGDSITMI